jgi:hypothetical protein
MSAGTDPEVAATVRLLHRRQGWIRAAFIGAIALLLAGGGAYSAASSGAPPPLWFNLIVAGLGVLTVVSVAAAVIETVLLGRRAPSVRSQAGSVAAEHPAGRRARHYPPRHRLSWTLGWIGMLLILAVAVVSVPGVVNGVAYLTGGEKVVTFSPVSYSTDCQPRGGCTTSTVGILETGGQGTHATWPDEVPLGQPFGVREPVWRWGLGEALIDSTGIAVVAIVVSLLIEAAGVAVLLTMIRLARNWLRHRREKAAPVAAPAA